MQQEILLQYLNMLQTGFVFSSAFNSLSTILIHSVTAEFHPFSNDPELGPGLPQKQRL